MYLSLQKPATEATNKKGKTSRKSVSVYTMMLDKFQNDVPKGAARQKLEQEGKTKRMFASRTSSPQQVNEKIGVAFGTNDYTFLECIKGGNKLIISSNQAMDGRDVIERRGCLYLFRNTPKVKATCTSSVQ